jgi:uroporphyrinogen-III synthase
MGGRVLIVRPQLGAAHTGKRLEELGFEPVILPLTEVRPVSARLPADLAFDAVAVSSANALRHADPALLQALAGLAVFAVGPRTAEAAADAGFATPTAGPGNGEALASLMARHLPPGARIAYLCGCARAASFEQALAAAGVTAFPIETYDTVMLDHADEELEAKLGTEPFGAVLLHSRIGAEQFSKLADRSAVSRLFSRSVLICISERVALPLARFDGRVLVAAAPNEEAMLALLAA